RLRDLRALFARLSPPPAARGGSARRAARIDPQPALLPAAARTRARGDPWAPPGGAAGGDRGARLRSAEIVGRERETIPPSRRYDGGSRAAHSGADNGPSSPSADPRISLRRATAGHTAA